MGHNTARAASGHSYSTYVYQNRLPGAAGKALCAGYLFQHRADLTSRGSIYSMATVLNRKSVVVVAGDILLFLTSVMGVKTVVSAAACQRVTECTCRVPVCVCVCVCACVRACVRSRARSRLCVNRCRDAGLCRICCHLSAPFGHKSPHCYGLCLKRQLKAVSSVKVSASLSPSFQTIRKPCGCITDGPIFCENIKHQATA